MTCSECNISLGSVFLTICGHILCLSCAQQPTRHTVPHTCLCEEQYGPGVSLHNIAADRAREREREAA